MIDYQLKKAVSQESSTSLLEQEDDAAKAVRDIGEQMWSRTVYPSRGA